MVNRWWLAVVALSLPMSACSGTAEEAGTGPQPAVTAPSGEEYAAASHEACEDYLGALFTLAQTDEELDVHREDASTELFLRRSGDIASLYADYRSSIASLQPPDGSEPAHEEIVGLMGDNLETMTSIARARERGDERAAELMTESSRIDDEIAAVQTGLGIRPCGR